MRITVVAVAVATLAFAGCSADADGDGSGSAASPSDAPAAASSPASDPSAVTTASATPDAGSPGGTSGAAAGLDPYCEAADAGYLEQVELLKATDAKSVQTGIADDAGSIDAAHAAAERMLEAIDGIEDAWGDAQDQLLAAPWDDSGADITTAQADAAFSDFFAYLDALARPEAELVLQSGSIADYDEGMVALLSLPDVAETAQSGAAAVSTVLTYTLARCGDLPET